MHSEMPNTTIYGLKDEKQEAARAVNKIRKLQVRKRRSAILGNDFLQTLASINILFIWVEKTRWW